MRREVPMPVKAIPTFGRLHVVEKIFALPRSNQIAVCLFALFLLGVSDQQAYAQCAAQAREGNWANADPNTSSLTRAELRFTCQDQVLNGQPYPPGPP